MKLKVGRLLWLDVSQQHVQMGRFFLLFFCVVLPLSSPSSEDDSTVLLKVIKRWKRRVNGNKCVSQTASCLLSFHFRFQEKAQQSFCLIPSYIQRQTSSQVSPWTFHLIGQWKHHSGLRLTPVKHWPNLPSSNDLPTAAVKSHTGQMHLQHLLVHTGIALYIKLNGGPEFSHLKRQTLVRSGQKLKHQNSSQTDRSLMLVRSWKLNPVNEPQLWIHSKNNF